MGSFWKDLPKPFLVLAPMDDVTDNAFREVVASCARPDVFFTEFVSADGLVSEGFEKVARKLKYEPHQHPIVAQLWGKNPDNFYASAKIIQKLDEKFYLDRFLLKDEKFFLTNKKGDVYTSLI